LRVRVAVGLECKGVDRVREGRQEGRKKERGESVFEVVEQAETNKDQARGRKANGHLSIPSFLARSSSCELPSPPLRRDYMRLGWSRRLGMSLHRLICSVPFRRALLPHPSMSKPYSPIHGLALDVDVPVWTL